MKVSRRLTDLWPIPNNWFSPTALYEGHGMVEFAHPAGMIEGATRVFFDERGKCTAEVAIETVPSEIENAIQFMAFMEGVELPHPEKGKAVVLEGRGRQNVCTAFTVRTSEGVFTAKHNIFCSYTLDKESVLKLHVALSQFDPISQQIPRFWVLPLSNFVSEFAQRHPLLDRHPLRIYPTPGIPPDLKEEERSLAPFIVHSKNHLILFEFSSALAFIEKLPDYDERKRDLLSGQIGNLITAVMIGEIGSNSMDLDRLEAWLPSDYLDLLSIATGARIGTPWIEFRDAQGHLVRRIHTAFRRPAYASGHSSISEVIHRGTGHLISAYSSSEVFGKPYFLAALSNAIDGQMDGDTEENNLRHLVVAFETLCKEFGFSTQDLAQELPDASRVYVRNALESAALQIESKAAGLDPQTHEDEIRALHEIAKRTTQTPLGTSRAFGLAMIQLLDHFGLPDARILDAHFKVNPRLDRKPTWDQVLSFYRGVVMHEGYFDQTAGTVDTFELYRVRRHLHDIFLRIFFKLVGYRETYQPPVKVMAIQSLVDWVTSATPAKDLGF
jgi:hypothetical protein